MNQDDRLLRPWLVDQDRRLVFAICFYTFVGGVFIPIGAAVILIGLDRGAAALIANRSTSPARAGRSYPTDQRPALVLHRLAPLRVPLALFC